MAWKAADGPWRRSLRFTGMVATFCYYSVLDMNETFLSGLSSEFYTLVRGPEVDLTFCSENLVTFFLPGVDRFGVSTRSTLAVKFTYFFVCPRSFALESALEMTLGATLNS